MTSELATRSEEFAAEVGDLLRDSLGADVQIVSVRFGDRYAVRPAGDGARQQRIPLRVNGEHLADLSLALYQTLDRAGRHLKTTDSRRVPTPHDLSKVHLPVGGERFRPGLEDLIEMLIRDCGVDSADGWREALAAGRERWRHRQFRTSVRDLQDEAASVLRAHGWTVSPPALAYTPHLQPYRAW